MTQCCRPRSRPRAPGARMHRRPSQVARHRSSSNPCNTCGAWPPRCGGRTASSARLSPGASSSRLRGQPVGRVLRVVRVPGVIGVADHERGERLWCSSGRTCGRYAVLLYPERGEGEVLHRGDRGVEVVGLADGPAGEATGRLARRLRAVAPPLQELR
eukprot:14048494-Alexandrium_andersonii.AAC.1